MNNRGYKEIAGAKHSTVEYIIEDFYLMRDKTKFKGRKGVKHEKIFTIRGV